MANGDEIAVKGGTRRSIDIAAGTSTVTLVPGVASKLLVIKEFLLLTKAAAKVELLEETSGTSLFGPFDTIAGVSISLGKEDSAIEVPTAGRGLQISRGSSTAVTGYVIYESYSTTS